jgi:UDP-N-acetylglucosamine acyltransferase
MEQVAEMTPFGVSQGDDCTISPTARFIGCVTLGRSVTVSDGAVIGSAGQHLTEPTEWQSVVHIGNGSVVREFVVIQRGLVPPGEDTKRYWGTNIGQNCYIMHGVHIPHDCYIGNDVILSPFVALAGHTAILDGAMLGLGAMVHQHVTIGHNAMIGMGSVVLHDVPPCAKVVGSPARLVGANTVGVERNGYDADRVGRLWQQYKAMAGDRPEVKA